MATIAELLHWARSELGNDEARLDAEILLAWVMERERVWLRTWPERVVEAKVRQQFEECILRRQKGEPVAYITGVRSFWNRQFKVTPETLIPRPETELLVEWVLELARKRPIRRIADLGTGSGCIALSLAEELPDAEIFATDASAGALQVASENARSLQLKNVHFALGSWCYALPDQPFDLIVSNPPYIEPGDVHLDRGDVRFEPESALVAEDRGLADLKVIAHQARRYLADEGWLLMEHGCTQGPEVAALLNSEGYGSVQTRQDLAGRDRATGGNLKRKGQ